MTRQLISESVSHFFACSVKEWFIMNHCEDSEIVANSILQMMQRGREVTCEATKMISLPS